VTGFRVALGGAQARYGITPDLTTLAKILAGGLPGGAVAGKADIISMIEFRNDQAWNAERRVQHPGTFNANPLSAAAGATMLKVARTGEPHAHANALNEKLVGGMNEVLEKSGAAGCVYGLASYFHVTLGKYSPRPSVDIEWPENMGAPPRMAVGLTLSLRRAMLNEGVDLMGGAGGFVSGVHTTADIERTIAAFGAAVAALRGEGSL
jgi:glutamate-1-semialdehyde 2,1-aminomutase